MAKKSSPAKKLKNQRSWARGEARKKARKELDQSAQKRNKDLKANGELTPYEQTKANRRERLSTKNA